MPAAMTAAEFIKKLKTYRSPEELKKIQRYFKTGAGEYGEGDEFMGVRMGQVFTLAKEFIEMPPADRGSADVNAAVNLAEGFGDDKLNKLHFRDVMGLLAKR